MSRYFLTAFLCLTSPLLAVDWNVPAGGNLQGAINSSQPGDTITLQAGATYQGTYTLPKKSGSDWITIRSSKLSALPPDGVRVTPADAVNMPKLMAFTSNPIVVTSTGANHYRFVGIEFVTQSGVYNYSLICFGYGNETTLDALPQYLELDRVYIHGDLNVGTKRGITLNSKDTVIKNSWISGIAATAQEATAIQGWNGPGPYTIVNNHIEASSIGILFGGAVPAINGVVPSDIQVLRNHFFKPLSWKQNSPGYAGRPWWIKNHFEIKNAQRVTVDGNVFENVWQDQQSGFAIVLADMSESGAAPWVVAQDIKFTNNIIRHAGSGINMSGSDGIIAGGRRMTIQNNLLEDINSGMWGGYGRLFQILNQASNISITHNTGFQTSSVLFSDGPVPNNGLVLQNNIAPENHYGIVGSGMGIGNTALAYYFPGAVVSGNVLPLGTAASYPAGNFFPASLSDVGFVNLAGGDFRLALTSRYKNAGTDGRDPGVDYDALLAATASTMTGNPFTTNLVPAPSASAVFVMTDDTTQGSWRNAYGVAGYAIAYDSTSIPPYAQGGIQGYLAWQYAASTTDVRALQRATNVNDRVAGVWYSSSNFTVDLNFTDGQAHTVAFYIADYDRNGRVETVQVVDAATGSVLSTRSESAFTGGRYLVWKLSGHVKARFAPTAGPNAVLSGIFFN